MFGGETGAEQLMRQHVATTKSAVATRTVQVRVLVLKCSPLPYRSEVRQPAPEQFDSVLAWATSASFFACERLPHVLFNSPGSLIRL